MSSLPSHGLSRRTWLSLAGAALPLLARAQADRPGASFRIDVNAFVNSSTPFPLGLEGYSGEVAAVLRFDLEVAGCAIVASGDARLILSGKGDGHVEGRLADKNGGVLLAKSYTGGSLRQQAHALSDDVIKALGGRGVARTRIAFKCEPSEGRSEIYVADYDGFSPQPITSDGSIVAAPTWVPGSLTLLYTSYRLGNPDIFHHDLDSRNRRVFSRRAGLNTAAAVSADGQRVAMILSKDGSPNVYVSRMDGSGLARLTDNRQGDSSPCWSPDGKQICYSSRQGGPSTLYTVAAAGGPPRKVRLAGVSNATEPDWSPDGKLLAFTTQSGGRFEVCVAPAAGGDVTRLVQGEDPVWGPNSRTVICARRVGNGKRTLSLLDVSTRQTKDLPRLSGSCSQPTWAR